jgi:MFS family permease
MSQEGESKGSKYELTYDSEHGHLRARDVLNRDVILILITYFIFQLSNIAYNSLYPIFAQAPPPTGRNLSPQEIGVSLAFAGAVTIAFQIGIFGRLRNHMGNRTTYRAGLAGFVIAFLLMPWVGYKEKNGAATTTGKVWLWVELGAVLIIKTVAAVGGLTSALLLVSTDNPELYPPRLPSHTDARGQITNSARDHTVLGALNGLAQTLSAAGRAAGPFISGGLFSLATRVHPKGEALAFGVFGGVSFLGFLISFGIRGSKLEDSEWEGDAENDDSEEGGHDANEAETSPLLNGRGK